jgi:copper homeostasis protein (lipoprotein)
MSSPHVRRLAPLALTLLAACSSSRAPERGTAAANSSGAAVAASGGIEAPVTYVGRLPCADCPGIQLTITLFPDSTFRLRWVYEERPSVFRDIGRWSVRSPGTQLVLRGGGAAPERFGIVGRDTLRMLDRDGRPIESPMNSKLSRARAVDPVSDTLPLRGTFTYMADAGRFTECRLGVGRPVAKLGDNAALEHAYLAAHPAPGAPRLVTFLGHFAPQPAMEGERLIEHVVVDRFQAVLPDSSCEEGARTDSSSRGR